MSGRTSNIEHSRSRDCAAIGCWVFDVRCFQGSWERGGGLLRGLTRGVRAGSLAGNGCYETDIYRRRAGADLALNKYDETISDLTNSLQADPNQPLLYNERGGLFIAKERYKQAIDDYTMAIRLAPEFVTAYINRGIAYGRSGKHEAALADFEKALALNPGDATALAGKSVAEKMLRASKPTGSG